MRRCERTVHLTASLKRLGCSKKKDDGRNWEESVREGIDLMERSGKYCS